MNNLEIIKHQHFGRIEKVVDAKEFLKIISGQRNKIYRTEILIPRLGSNSLGKFKITYK